MIRTTGARFVIVAASVLVLSMLPAASPYSFQPIGRNSYQALDSSDIPNSADNGRRSDLNDDVGIRPGLPGDPSLERPKPRTQPVNAGGKNLGIPARLLQAYQGTALRLSFADPACKLDWPILAGIGKVESNHAWNGRVDERGTTVQSILGPVLDGSRYAAVPDTDGGSLDGDRRWDRAVGPMQFIPSSWARFAADGNGDGVMSPHNVFDAIYAAGTYLCVGQVDLSKPDALSRAIYRYNHSPPYVQAVSAWIEAYRNGEVRPVNGSTDPVVVADDDRSRPASTPSPAPEPTNPGPRPVPSPAPTDPGPVPTTPGPAPVPTEPTPTPTPSPTPTPGQWCPLEPLPLPLPSVCL